MKRTLLVVATAVLVLAAPAAAKEITAVSLCGAEGCSDVAVPEGLHEFPGGGSSASPPPPAGPFLEVVLTFDRRHTERLWYVPSERLFAVGDAPGGSIRWLPAGTHRIDRVIAAAAAVVTPHRPRATAAFVDGDRVVGDVSGYLGLFGVESAGTPDLRGDRGFSLVSIKTAPASPWAQTQLWFYPEAGLLQRGFETITLPSGIASDLRAARPIDPDHGGGGFDWPLVTGSLLLALGLALTAALLSRRGRQPRPA